MIKGLFLSGAMLYFLLLAWHLMTNIFGTASGELSWAFVICFTGGVMLHARKYWHLQTQGNDAELFSSALDAGASWIAIIGCGMGALAFLLSV